MYYEDNHNKIYNEDCRNMEELGDESVDLIATDPPWGISFMGKDWDTFNELVEPQGAYQKKKGFKKLPRQNTISMAEFFIPIWKECLRILKPGAFAFVMCSPRADVMAKQVSCLQDAGFRVNFTPIYHAYAQGFPKAQNIGKAVDKRLGNKREVVGHYIAPDGHWRDCNDHKPNEEIRNPETAYGYKTSGFRPIDKGESPLEGSYGGFQPKPAVEVILVAMKPLSEKTFVDQALKNRKGITWLDSVKIPYESEGDLESAEFHKGMATHVPGDLTQVTGYRKPPPPNPTGRFPANLLVSDDVLNDGRIRASGTGAVKRNTGKGYRPNAYGIESRSVGTPNIEYGDSGSFSRYFDLDKWWAKKLKDLPQSAQRTFPFLIVSKASKGEKNKGLETMTEVVKSGLPLRDGSGDYVLNEYGDSSMSTRNTKTRNYHPTVKPIKLMSYLVTLGSREGDTVVDPFIGTGATAIACQILGRKCTGYEINANYCEIAKSRLTYYCQKAMNL